MPGLYGPDEYDLAGFAVGACEKEQLIDGRNIEPGDVLLGLASSGLHSNGFSLVRKIVLEEAQINLHSYSEELGCSWAEELLRPTKISDQVRSKAWPTLPVVALWRISRECSLRI